MPWVRRSLAHMQYWKWNNFVESKAMAEPPSRNEYESFVHNSEVRHTELRLEMKELETDLKSQMGNIVNKMDALSNQMASRSLDIWKLVATSTVSLIAGYVLSYLQHLAGK